jgi:hypothetical protein
MAGRMEWHEGNCCHQKRSALGGLGPFRRIFVGVWLKPKLELRPDQSVDERDQHNIDANVLPVVGDHR